MANISIVPPLNAKGIYTLRTPWVSDLTHEYTCIAVRRFEDLATAGVDVYSEYYSPKGLTQQNYLEDLNTGAMLVTLAGANTGVATMYVPSTYIAQYPNQSTVEYKYTVVGVNLGALYSGVDLSNFVEQVGELAVSVLGVVAPVTVNTATLVTTVTAEQHEIAEANRQAAITNNTTLSSRIVDLENQLAASKATNARMAQILRDHGLLT
ncbi:hypothetical protein PP187_gp165 [Klebsiella phage vB_KvM-Eowyn]|jgi:hypothetical protein|uniref:Uncharacterized protein n=1 Tax=Klebsiella phage vB_KvM-Eowyn TaxID=2762819 RepID=A0A7R8MJH6_9CAUD|nr:hypothetical protein PP187_gp165 [Klebsiella phage vB_KvM-Eowyn]CAD5236154.1 hypothetical protein LLCLJKAH_00165 [Klebsiella phage vB_KvM-Eowyn]